MITPKTSVTHPMRIDALPFGRGSIGLTFCPGKKQTNALSGIWHRDLELDLDAMAAWGCTEVITLIEPWEFDELSVHELGASIAQRGWRWHHWPITDRGAPDDRFLARWFVEQESLRSRLRDGGRLVVHCKGGLGRAGTTAAMLLSMEHPEETVADLITRVRATRPGAIETSAQERFLHGQTWSL
jgi:ADP-ribosyl-[dinitrogen reductase] hydrolase